MYKTTVIMFITLMLSACSMSINKAIDKPSPGQKPPSVQSAIYVEQLKLASGYTLVVSEGALEPRSIGSITVKLYRDLMVGDFASGLSFVRDGTVLKSVLIENGTDKQKLSITTVTAGSGNYQNSQLVCIQAEQLTLC